MILEAYYSKKYRELNLSENMITTLIEDKIREYNYDYITTEIQIQEKLDENVSGTLYPSKALVKYINQKSKLKTEMDVINAISKFRKTRDKKIFNELIKKYSKMMANLIYTNTTRLLKVSPNLSFDEIFNTMVLNFNRAIELFDPNRKIMFSTYLNNWLREVIQNPRHFLDKFTAKNKKVIASLDVKYAKNSDNDGSTLGDSISDSSIEDMEVSYKKSKMMIKVEKEIDKFPDNMKAVMKYKLGLVDTSEVKNKTGSVTDVLIAKKLNISSPTVKSLYVTGLSKIKKYVVQ